MGELFDVLDEHGEPSGRKKDRREVHRDGDWHRAVHVWLWVEETQELLIQQRSSCKDSWANLWDISAAGHLEASQTSLSAAQRETAEELGIQFPPEALEFLFTFKIKSTDAAKPGFVNNEFDDVYLVTIQQRIPLDAFTLQVEEVSAVKYIHFTDLEKKVKAGDPELAMNMSGDHAQYQQFFDLLRARASRGGLLRPEILQPGSGESIAPGTVIITHPQGGSHITQQLRICARTFPLQYIKLVSPEER